MITLAEINSPQNQKRARKMLTFDFYLTCKDEKTIQINIGIGQKFFNNIFSKKEKGQLCCNRIDPKNKPYHQLNKKEVCL